MKKIIDVSKWNGIVNFSSIHKKIDGVIVRVGYRGSTSPIIVNDPRYFPYMTELNNYGNPVGCYFITSAINEEEARDEANVFIDDIEKTGITLSIPLFVRTAWNNNSHNGRSDSLSAEERTSIIIAFIEACKQRGYGCGISASSSWFINNLCLDKLEGYAKWLTDKVDKNTLSTLGDSVMITLDDDKFNIKGIAGYVNLSIIKPEILGPYIKKEEPKVTEVKEDKKESKKVVKKTEPKKKEYKPGARIKLTNAELFKTSVSSTVVDTISGTYYISDGKVLRGRIRISEKKTSESIGWVVIDK